MKFTADALNSVVEVSLRSPSLTVTASNKAMVKELLKHVPAHKRKEMKKRLHASSRFVPLAGTVLGELRSEVNAFKSAAVKKNLDRGYKGISKLGKVNGYIVRLENFEHFESIVRSHTPRIESLVERIKDEWDDLKERGAEDMDVYSEGFTFPSLKKFLKRSEFGFTVESTLKNDAWINTALSETATRVRAMAEKSTERKLLEAHYRPVEIMLNGVAECIERLERADGKNASGKKARLRADKFNALKELVSEVRTKNFLDLPELEVAANTVASLVEGLDVVDLDPAERKEKAKTFTKVHEVLEDRMAAAGL